MKKTITAYEAQHSGLREFEAHELEKFTLHKRIDELEKKIKTFEGKEIRFNLTIKTSSFECGEVFLNKFLTAVQPIKEVVHAEWSRKKEVIGHDSTS